MYRQAAQVIRGVSPNAIHDKQNRNELDDIRGLQRRHKFLQLLDLSRLVDAAVELAHCIAQVAKHQLS